MYQRFPGRGMRHDAQAAQPPAGRRVCLHAGVWVLVIVPGSCVAASLLGYLCCIQSADLRAMPATHANQACAHCPDEAWRQPGGQTATMMRAAASPPTPPIARTSPPKKTMRCRSSRPKGSPAMSCVLQTSNQVHVATASVQSRSRKRCRGAQRGNAGGSGSGGRRQGCV